MGEHSKIEWTDASWTPIRARNTATGKVGWHCEHVSEGCRNCYAEGINARLGTGVDFKPGARGRDVEIFLDEEMLLAPLRWKRPRRVFVCSMTDAFAEFVPDEWLDRIFAVMALAPQHTFQVLTKRSKRMREYCSDRSRPLRVAQATKGLWIDGPLWETTVQAMWPMPNVWLGVSAEDQARADERIPHLLATPAAVRFVSGEPLLELIDLARIRIALGKESFMTRSSLHARDNLNLGSAEARLDWVIVGGESGRGARPMHPDWVRSIRDQCAAASVPFFFKQWGEWLPGQNDIFHLADDGRRVAHWQDGIWGPRDLSRLQLTKSYVMWEPNGSQHAGGTRLKERFEVAAWAQRVGKQRAGRLLDGREHNDLPRSAGA